MTELGRDSHMMSQYKLTLGNGSLSAIASATSPRTSSLCLDQKQEATSAPIIRQSVCPAS